jgi:endonuclease YncB( thermonuclease family)
MLRPFRVLGIVLLIVLFSAGALGEIVKITADQARFYDAETKELKTYEAKGKRFLVYGVQKDWYLVEATINKEKKLVWLAMADAAIDWTGAKAGRVASVVDTNTVKLDDGRLVQFAGIEVTRGDTVLTRQTYEWLKRLLEGKQVVLEYEAGATQGSAAAYVYVEGLFVNRTLVEYGAATAPEPSATAGGRYAAVFGYYAEQARQARRGMWAVEQGAAAASPQAGSGQDSSGPVRQLTQAELVQWNLRLQVNVMIRTERIKDDDGKDKAVCLRGPVTIAPDPGPSAEASAAIITAA